MSKSIKARKDSNGSIKVDDYFNSGAFEVARIGKNVIVSNNRTPEQQKSVNAYLHDKYLEKYSYFRDKILCFKEKVLKCDPYELLRYLRVRMLMQSVNVFSESDNSDETNAIVIAQEYIQSIYITETPNIQAENLEKAESYFAEVVDGYCELHKELQFFYYYWAAYVKNENKIEDALLREVVEAQYMFWVRGKRYQVLELEPLKRLIQPHNEVLCTLFGVSASEILMGLEKLQYALSQGYADAMVDLGKEFEQFTKEMDAGGDSEKAMAEASKRSSTTIRKLFGSDLINVKRITDWDDRFIRMLSAEVHGNDLLGGEGEFAGWPIVDMPVAKKPFIIIDGIAYAFLYYALFDNIYRNIQKGIMREQPGYLEQWKMHQTNTSEEMVRDIFLKLLPGAQSYIGNYYPQMNSKKNLYENDIIITYFNYLFIVEVKAGSYPTTPPIIDFKAHIDAYKKLAETADSQCSRTLKYIETNDCAQFYDKNRNTTFRLSSIDSYDEVYTISVTVDSFNYFAAKAEKSSIISLKKDTIVVSYDDLLAYSLYFDSSVAFLHYLKQRKSAIGVSIYQMNDELDHLGLYIDRNLYALNPSQYGDVKEVHWTGFRQKLDYYFNMLYVAPDRVVKPLQNIPLSLVEIVGYLQQHISVENIRLAHFFLDFSTEAKEEMAAHIRYCIFHQRDTGNSMPIRSIGDVNYCLFVTTPDVHPLSMESQNDYTYAVASRVTSKTAVRVSLEYDSWGRLISVSGRECSMLDLAEDKRDKIQKMGEEKAQEWVRRFKLKQGKIGRNDICPCGSGKKFKNCCLKTNPN